MERASGVSADAGAGRRSVVSTGGGVKVRVRSDTAGYEHELLKYMALVEASDSE